MGSSGGGSANPAYLSMGGTPMPGVPIAGQGTPAPQEMGSFQEFLPQVSPAGTAGNQILPAGQGPAPLAHGLTSEMFKYRSPSGILTPAADSGGSAAAATAAPASGGGSAADIQSLRSQLAQLQASQGQQQGAPWRDPFADGSGSRPWGG